MARVHIVICRGAGKVNNKWIMKWKEKKKKKSGLPSWPSSLFKRQWGEFQGKYFMISVIISLVCWFHLRQPLNSIWDPAYYANVRENWKACCKVKRELLKLHLMLKTPTVPHYEVCCHAVAHNVYCNCQHAPSDHIGWLLITTSKGTQRIASCMIISPNIHSHIWQKIKKKTLTVECCIIITMSNFASVKAIHFWFGCLSWNWNFSRVLSPCTPTSPL